MKKALEIYKKIAIRDDIEAIRELIRIYGGRPGFESAKNDREWIKWQEKAVALGDYKIAFQLGTVLIGDWHLDSVALNVQKGLRLIESAASRGLDEAQYVYGTLLLLYDSHSLQSRGDYIDINRTRSPGGGEPTEAARYFLTAAKQGHAYAQFELGKLYRDGHGVPKDYVLAYMWMNIAAASGSEQSEQNRDELAKHMTREQIAEAQRLSRECKQK